MAEGRHKNSGGRRFQQQDDDSDGESQGWGGESQGLGGESQGVARPAASMGGMRGGVRDRGGDPAIVKAAVSCAQCVTH
jgi:hypothetical protein